MIKLESQHLNTLFDSLKRRGYRIAGPTRRDDSIVYDEINSADELPAGWTDEQAAASYRLKKRNDNACFGYTVGPFSWKKFLFPPKIKLFTAIKKGKSFEVNTDLAEAVPQYAFIGMRACDLHAIGIQDKVFGSQQYTDTTYRKRREKIFIAAVNCTQAGGTCFCASMSCGPKVSLPTPPLTSPLSPPLKGGEGEVVKGGLGGVDLAMTEVINGNEHFFIIEAGSEKGEDIMKEIPHINAVQSDIETAERLIQRASQQMGRSMDTKGIKEFLFENLENPHWDDIARRCLTCANCTMVCPTCFCTTVEDVTDLSGNNAERWRRWDSCFTVDFAKVHGGNFRSSAKARYRQWMTHKLASWIEQFGASGCVGCGRCITWCPVGIDITEEIKKIKEKSM
ncbi:MAG: 4Fe-4S dicluster domain-containing protein [Nitrospinae bacterium]|nr:4Fe-4S dicluster domain-containing protein [Nitrospinota bacterium]